MHVYCINLEHRSDRRARCRREFDREGLDVEFFRATNGRKDTPSHLYITPPEYGCASSHVRVWRDVVEKGYDAALVLEDDVSLCSNFKDKLDVILEDAERVPGWDIISLGSIIPIVRRNVTEHLVEAQPLGTHAYVINLECAKKISVFEPELMKVGIDFQINRFPLKVLCTHERLASQGDTASRQGFLSIKSLFDGDIKFSRTMDFGYVVRYTFQTFKGVIILLFMLLVLRYVRLVE
jgi:GR25 family glycosyltransferase involved in LPS biosynthesis